jgi:hypothetical protein
MGYYIMSILDESQQVQRRFKISPKAGLNEFVWNFTTANSYSIDAKNASGTNDGFPVLPGKYFAQMSFFDGAAVKNLTEPEPFEVKSLGLATMPIKDMKTMEIFMAELKELARVVFGTSEHVTYLKEKLATLKAAALVSNIASLGELNAVEKQLQKISLELDGNESLENRQFEVLPGINNRLSKVVYGMYGHSSEPTSSQKENLAFTKRLFSTTYALVKTVDSNLNQIQKNLKSSPYIKGTLPDWNK